MRWLCCLKKDDQPNVQGAVSVLFIHVNDSLFRIDTSPDQKLDQARKLIIDHDECPCVHFSFIRESDDKVLKEKEKEFSVVDCLINDELKLTFDFDELLRHIKEKRGNLHQNDGGYSKSNEFTESAKTTMDHLSKVAGSLKEISTQFLPGADVVRQAASITAACASGAGVMCDMLVSLLTSTNGSYQVDKNLQSQFRRLQKLTGQLINILRLVKLEGDTNNNSNICYVELTKIINNCNSKYFKTVRILWRSNRHLQAIEKIMNRSIESY